MVEENVPGIQINVHEESKGSLTSRSNEATQVNEERETEEVTSFFSDPSKEAKKYEEAIIYIAKTNIKNKGGIKLQNIYEDNPSAARVSNPDGHFYLEEGIKAQDLIPRSRFLEGEQDLKPNSRVLIEVKTKLPKKYKELEKQIKESYKHLQTLNQKLLLSPNILKSSIGNYLIVFNGSDPDGTQVSKLKNFVTKINMKIIGIIYCAYKGAIYEKKKIKRETSVIKKHIKNQVKDKQEEKAKRVAKQIEDGEMQLDKQEEKAKRVGKQIEVLKMQLAKQKEDGEMQLAKQEEKAKRVAKQIEVGEMQLAKQKEDGEMQLDKQEEKAKQVAKQIKEEKKIPEERKSYEQMRKKGSYLPYNWKKKKSKTIWRKKESN